MNRYPVANYAGSFNGRILEELGYRTKEDLLNAKVYDLLLIGSFSRYDVVKIICNESPLMLY